MIQSRPQKFSNSSCAACILDEVVVSVELVLMQR